MGLKLNMPFIVVVVLGMTLLVQSVPIENQPDVPSDSEPAKDPLPSGNLPTGSGEKMWPFMPFPSSITTLFQGSAPVAPPPPPPPPPPPVIFINPPPPPPTTTTTTTSTTTTTTPATTTTTSSTTTTPPPPPPPPRN